MLKADARGLRDDMLEEIESMENADDDGALDEVEYYKSRFAHVRRELQNAIMVYEARCVSEGLPSTDVVHDDRRRVQVDGATAEQIGAWEVLQADRERRLQESQINALELDLEERPGAQATTATDSSRWTVVDEGSAIGRFGRLAFAIDTADRESELIVQPNLEEWPTADVMDALDDIPEHLTTRVIGSFESMEAAQRAAEKLVAQGYQIPLTDK